MKLIDTVIVVAYMLGMIAIGFYANRKQKDTEDYYVAGRNLGTGSIMVLWVASWVGGASIIGGGGTAYDLGVTAVWYVGSGIIGCLLFALTISPLVNRIGTKLQNITYPELIESRYDSRCQIITTITTFLAYIGYTAGQIAAAGNILHVLVGWELSRAYIISAVVVVLYTSIGGYLAVTYTDWAQFALLFLGITIIGIPVSWSAVGGFAGLRATLPAGHFDLGAWGWGTILGMVVSITFSYFTAMDSYTRMFAAKDEKSARNGTILAIVFLGLVAFSATFMGMAARSIFPGLEGGGAAVATMVTEFFPPVIKGLVLAGILAAIMSTGDISILTASANITEDIYHRYINPKASDKFLLRMGMVCSLIVGVLATLLALKMVNIISMLYLAFTINSAGLFLPTFAAFYWKKANASSAFWSMTLALVTVLVWAIGGQAGWGPIFNVDPVWPGLIVSAVVFISMSLLVKPSETDLQKINDFMSF